MQERKVSFESPGSQLQGTLDTFRIKVKLTPSGCYMLLNDIRTHAWF